MGPRVRFATMGSAKGISNKEYLKSYGLRGGRSHIYSGDSSAQKACASTAHCRHKRRCGVEREKEGSAVDADTGPSDLVQHTWNVCGGGGVFCI